MLPLATWIWTWQDPVALALAALCLLGSYLLWRRTSAKKGHGCAACAANPAALKEGDGAKGRRPRRKPPRPPTPHPAP